MTDRIVFFDNAGQNMMASSDINVNSISVNGVPVTTLAKDSIKAIVDPTGNVGPVNGLLVLAGGASPQLTMPLRSNTNVAALKLANGFINSPNGDFTLFSNYIAINNPGEYTISLDMLVVATNQNFRMSFWIQELGDTIFVNPNLAANAIRQGNAVTFGPYTFGYISSATNIIKTTAPKNICLNLFLDNTSTVEIIRTSSLSISRI